MFLLYNMSFIYYKIYVIARICIKSRFLEYLFIINNVNIIFDQIIIIAYIKNFIANKY